MKNFIFKKSNIRFLLLTLSCGILYCGTETTNEFTVYMPDGITPAPGTCIAFMPDNGDNTQLADTVFADAFGRFTVPTSLPSGKWSIMFTLDNDEPYAAWQESVIINGQENSVQSDTLEYAGSISGIVDLQPQDRYWIEGVTVQLLGTTRSTNAGPLGTFTLNRIPPGMFTLRCSAPLSMPDYGLLDKEIYRSTGKDTVLTDTLKLPYLGIPIVHGVQADFDSYSGIVHVQWDSIPEEYEAMILRSPENAAIKPQDTVAVTKSNQYDDTLFTSEDVAKRYSITDTAPHVLEYQVRLRDSNYMCGKTHIRALVRVISPFVYHTQMTMIYRCASTMDSCRTIVAGDTLIIETGFSNSHTPIGALQYFNTPTDSLLFETPFSPPLLNGNDTILINSTNTGDHTLLVKAIDTLGTQIPFSIDTIHFRIVPPLLGDVTLDGIIDAADAAIVARYMLGTISLTDSLRFYSDVNLDGYISTHDAYLISYYDVKLIPTLPFTYTIGDVNLDRAINTADMSLINNYFKDSTSLDWVNRTLADVNGDNSVTDLDAQLISEYVTGTIEEFPFLKK